MAFPEILGDDKFARGVLRYVYSLPGDSVGRIYVPVMLANTISRLALVDTGATTSIVNSQDFEDLNLAHDDEPTSSRRIGGHEYRGSYSRIVITLDAQNGSGISLETRVFVPQLEISQQPLPTLLGYQGFLDQLRFAVDPQNNLFYFASTGDDIDY